jgi:hypothetical protein
MKLNLLEDDQNIIFNMCQSPILMKPTNCRKTLILLLVVISSVNCRAQLQIDTTATAIMLASKLVGNGITISNATYNCNDEQRPSFQMVTALSWVFLMVSS